MGNFTAIDLSKLPAPKVIESLSYEEIFQDILSDFWRKIQLTQHCLRVILQ